MWTPSSPLAVTNTQRVALLKIANGRNTPQKTVLRSTIVLFASQGKSNNAIAKELAVNRQTVILWRKRFTTGGMDALKDKSRPGRKPKLSPLAVQKVIDVTLHEKPPAATHWSNRMLAKRLGLSKMTIQRIWKAHNIQPHRQETFKLSRDKHFVEKLTDVVGLYLDPPEHAIVLSVDEKSQIQALDRTQPSLPLVQGHAQTVTHDYKRNGTTSLFAALNVLEGSVIGECMSRHRHQEFLKFLKKIDRETPQDVDLHLIMDNYGTHKHPKVRAWMEKHPRFHAHFIPTSSSWLNLVERWFGEITRKRIRRGVFPSVASLEEAITEYLTVHNADPKPFVWTASAQSILGKIARAGKTLSIVQKR